MKKTSKKNLFGNIGSVAFAKKVLEEHLKVLANRDWYIYPGIFHLKNMNDINWRELTYENLELIEANPSNKIIVETDIAFRFSWARYLDGDYLMDHDEKAIRFAFLT